MAIQVRCFSRQVALIYDLLIQTCTSVDADTIAGIPISCSLDDEHPAENMSCRWLLQIYKEKNTLEQFQLSAVV